MSPGKIRRAETLWGVRPGLRDLPELLPSLGLRVTLSHDAGLVSSQEPLNHGLPFPMLLRGG